MNVASMPLLDHEPIAMIISDILMRDLLSPVAQSRLTLRSTQFACLEAVFAVCSVRLISVVRQS